MNNLSKKILWSVLAVAIIGTAFWLYDSQNKSTPPEALPTIRLSLFPNPYVNLFKIALDKNFFSAEGLKIEVKEFTAGKFALQALIGGSLDLAAAADLPITLALTNGEKISLLSEVTRTEGASRIILRKEAESFKPKEFFAKKRRIATTIGTDAEFFAAQFFKHYDIASDKYELVNMKPEDIPLALTDNSVDGVSIFEPFAYFTEQRVGTDKVFSSKNPELYSATMILVAKPEWATKNEKNIVKFLRALKRAQDFIKTNPEESLSIMSAYSKLDKEVLRGIWNTIHPQIGLSKKLIQTMTSQALWAKATDKILPAAAVPNFQDFIFATPLETVAPETIDL